MMRRCITSSRGSVLCGNPSTYSRRSQADDDRWTSTAWRESDDEHRTSRRSFVAPSPHRNRVRRAGVGSRHVCARPAALAYTRIRQIRVAHRCNRAGRDAHRTRPLAACAAWRLRARSGDQRGLRDPDGVARASALFVVATVLLGMGSVRERLTQRGLRDLPANSHKAIACHTGMSWRAVDFSASRNQFSYRFNMDTRNLKYFLAVADAGSITHAADCLN